MGDQLRINADARRHVPTVFSRLLEATAGGHALWRPRDSLQRGGEVGDCGYILDGLFWRICNCYDDPLPGLPRLPRPTQDNWDVEEVSNTSSLRSSMASTVRFSVSLPFNIPPSAVTFSATMSAEDAQFAFLSFAGPHRVETRVSLSETQKLERYLQKHYATLKAHAAGEVFLVCATITASGWLGGLSYGHDTEFSVDASATLPVLGEVQIGASRSHSARTPVGDGSCLSSDGPVNWTPDTPISYPVVLGAIQLRRQWRRKIPQSFATRVWDTLRFTLADTSQSLAVNPRAKKAQASVAATAVNARTCARTTNGFHRHNGEYGPGILGFVDDLVNLPRTSVADVVECTTELAKQPFGKGLFLSALDAIAAGVLSAVDAVAPFGPRLRPSFPGDASGRRCSDGSRHLEQGGCPSLIDLILDDFLHRQAAIDVVVCNSGLVKQCLQGDDGMILKLGTTLLRRAFSGDVPSAPTLPLRYVWDVELVGEEVVAFVTQIQLDKALRIERDPRTALFNLFSIKGLINEVHWSEHGRDSGQGSMFVWSATCHIEHVGTFTSVLAESRRRALDDAAARTLRHIGITELYGKEIGGLFI